jgi:hypothetical protein
MCITTLREGTLPIRPDFSLDKSLFIPSIVYELSGEACALDTAVHYTMTDETPLGALFYELFQFYVLGINMLFRFQ